MRTPSVKTYLVPSVLVWGVGDPPPLQGKRDGVAHGGYFVILRCLVIL